MTAYQIFLTHIAELSDILNAISILKWDARTQMPPGGAETRGYQLATLTRVAQEHFVSDQTARLLDAAERELAGADPDSYPVRAVQQTRQYFDIIRRIPLDLVSDKAALEPVSEGVWAAAKQNNDFASFAPYLQKQLDLAKRQADAVGYQDHPFDALVFEYEPSMNAAKLRTLFNALKAGLLPLLGKIVANDKPLERDLWQHDYPVDKQKIFALEVAQQFGYDLNRGRLDIAPHPFEISFTRQDVRITTRYNAKYLPMALYGTLHETGHALYEQGVDPELTRTPLTIDFLGKYPVGGTSYGAHESQSRLWENQIGRSREFWEVHFERLREIFPEQMAGATPDLLYRSVNRVRPSLIRVEADEVTYNLHIMLRVEIELGLLEGSIQVKDLPEVWNAKMQEYLGVTPPNDSKGVLQDIHWSGGGFGSFPGYTVGNVMSAQFLAAAQRDTPGLDAALASGNYQPLLGWLTENIYRHGRAYSASELLVRSTGHDLTVEPYLAYLTAKFTDLYKL
ncbi:MAG: carboxypeptidase M32 [Chloroflexi bacterium]|uniref:carboxypeptidase M32 n=1 Tax=Candidatus Flexifilum breve TaxID=3140694 RepID=UPI003136A7EA|nr:carboxypeptidase M32 [Chloroflexota bacterium]